MFLGRQRPRGARLSYVTVAPARTGAYAVNPARIVGISKGTRAYSEEVGQRRRGFISIRSLTPRKPQGNDLCRLAMV